MVLITLTKTAPGFAYFMLGKMSVHYFYEFYSKYCRVLRTKSELHLKSR